MQDSPPPQWEGATISPAPTSPPLIHQSTDAQHRNPQGRQARNPQQRQLRIYAPEHEVLGNPQGEAPNPQRARLVKNNKHGRARAYL